MASKESRDLFDFTKDLPSQREVRKARVALAELADGLTKDDHPMGVELHKYVQVTRAAAEDRRTEQNLQELQREKKKAKKGRKH